MSFCAHCKKSDSHLHLEHVRICVRVLVCVFVYISIGIYSLCLKWQVCLGCLISVLLSVSSAHCSQVSHNAIGVCVCVRALLYCPWWSHNALLDRS